MFLVAIKNLTIANCIREDRGTETRSLLYNISDKNIIHLPIRNQKPDLFLIFPIFLLRLMIYIFFLQAS